MLSLVPGFGTSLFDEFDNFFNRDRSFMRSGSNGLRNTGLMRTDVEVKDGLYLMKMDLPGYDKNDIKAELKDGYLTISAEKNENHEEKNEDGYVMRERYSGSCSRSFYVGSNVTEEDIQAAFQNGTLCLSFPAEPSKKEEERKLITIQ